MEVASSSLVIRSIKSTSVLQMCFYCACEKQGGAIPHSLNCKAKNMCGKMAEPAKKSKGLVFGNCMVYNKDNLSTDTENRFVRRIIDGIL